MKTRRLAQALLVATSLMLLVGATRVSAQSSWHAGIGTGLSRLNAEGDQGLNVGALGPVLAEVDLSPDDFNDLMQSAIGFGGYFTNGKWMVQYKLVQLKLGGEPSGTLQSGASYSAEWSFDITTGELKVGYTAYRHPQGKIALQPYGGVRYIKHEVGADLTVVAETTTNVSRGGDQNWTDVLLGTTVNVGLSPKVGWSTSFDVGFGGSNGTFSVATAVSWRPWKYLSLSPNAFFMAIDFENGEPGDTDWYLYDANEFGWGLSFLIHFL